MGNLDKDIDKILKSYKTDFKKPKEEVWNEMLRNIENTDTGLYKKDKNTVFVRNVWLVAASLIVLVVMSWILISYGNKEFYVENGKKKEIILPDNTVVIINSDTYLSYSKYLWVFNRRVKLDGEAYFQVVKGNKFKVITPVSQVEVLGTEFNTFSRGKIFDIRCFSGKVNVKFQKENIILSKGDAFYINKEVNKSRQYNFDYNNDKDWRAGEFFFEKKNLKYVFDELSRQFDVKIELPVSLNERLYTGYFNNEDLEEALKGVCLPMHLYYQVNTENLVVIYELPNN